ncbi:MAG: hypothetical protein HWQ41_31325 [Nostoc sp. NOS(2021)]|uniref:hypothetical protein n=1 Tax=Nostoc sp. NOS(2021) TaxID=2815407 RepID=UPI0025FDF9D4|nr:hypothetical protein [Nostoc sp. NOS(2021)]MBN3899598.1 hypothetical protein [Nostoc sp. NOS(2021)]
MTKITTQPKYLILMIDMNKAYQVAAIALLQNLSFHLFQRQLLACLKFFPRILNNC